MATQDVRRLADLYVSGSSEADWHVEDTRRKGYEAHHHVDLLRVVFQEGGQHPGYLWDFESLSTELRDAGLTQVARGKSGLSDRPALGRLERRVERGVEGPSSPIVLVVEAVRP